MRWHGKEWRVAVLFFTGLGFAAFHLLTREGDLPTNWMIIILSFVGLFPMAAAAIGSLSNTNPDEKNKDTRNEQSTRLNEGSGSDHSSPPGHVRMGIAWLPRLRRWHGIVDGKGHRYQCATD